MATEVKILYTRGKDKLVYDRADDKGDLWGHVVLEDGTSFASQLVASIVARGYWEPVDGNSDGGEEDGGK